MVLLVICLRNKGGRLHTAESVCQSEAEGAVAGDPEAAPPVWEQGLQSRWAARCPQHPGQHQHWAGRAQETLRDVFKLYFPGPFLHVCLTHLSLVLDYNTQRVFYLVFVFFIGPFARQHFPMSFPFLKGTFPDLGQVSS